MVAARKVKSESDDSKSNEGIKATFLSLEEKEEQNKIIGQFKKQIGTFVAAINKENKPKEKNNGKRMAGFQKDRPKNKDKGKPSKPG